MKRDRRLAARLLAGRDEPSVVEREEILEAVMRHPELGVCRRRSWLRLALPAATVAVSAAVVLLWVRPGQEASFRAKGGSEVSFSVSCAGDREGMAQCPLGGTLELRVRPTEELPHFAAIAHGGDDRTVWYLPRTEEDGIQAEASSADTLEVSIHLGPEHGAGDFFIHGLFSARPLSRAEVRERLQSEQDGSDVVVMRRALRVLP